MKKITITLIIVVVVVAAVIGWWWMLRSGGWSQLSPTLTPSPVVQSNQDLQDLDSINTGQNLDQEFQQIDQDLNNL